ncbi:MAG: hypothetical protein R3F14_02390 [Polyangiaceae bacterium]
MSAETLFIEGGAKVVDPSDGSTVGFVWVEAAPYPHGLSGARIQRWVLTRLLSPRDNILSSFRFEHWDTAPQTLAEWKQAVQTVAPASVQWGDDFGDGLWPSQKGAFYVVAQSAVAAQTLTNEGVTLTIPDPIYPRHDVVSALRVARGPSNVQSRSAATPARAVARPARAPLRPATRHSGRPQGPGGHPPSAAPRRDIAAPTKPPRQAVIPLFELRQWEQGRSVAVVGIGGGACPPFEGLEFFEGEELFLLYDDNVRAGSSGLMTVWQEVASNEILKYEDLVHHILTEVNITEGSRCEITGCNYYQDIDPMGINPPPSEFL